MSDNLSALNEYKFKEAISLTENSPTVVNRASVNESAVAFSISISNEFLKQLNEAVDKFSLSYVTILNSQVDFFQLLESERLNTRFKNLCYKVLLTVSSLKGGQRINYLAKQRSVTIFKTELINVREQQHQLKKLNEEKIEFERKCRELYQQLSLQDEQTTVISEQNLDIHTLEQKNAYLSDYIKELEKKIPKSIFCPDVDNLTPKTRIRTLKKLETDAQKALWFCETFGLMPQFLSLKSKNGTHVRLNFEETDNSSKFTSLSEQDQDKIRKLVFLIDKFCISDAAYHEFSMVYDEMPRSYLLVQCKNEMNKMFQIERLPGNVPGAMINLNHEIEKLLARHVEKHSDINKVKVKLSGDGAKVSRIANFVIFSFSNVSAFNKLSFQEQQTVAIVECSENYENLKKCCQPIFEQFNCIVSKRKWQVGEKELDVDFFVSADMKFIQILLGLCGSTGEYACPWCKVNKKGRSDLSVPWDFYHQPAISRNIEELSRIGEQGRKDFGIKNKPLLNLQVDHFIPDELHLMLRVTDVLLRNLIDDSRDLDGELRVNKAVAIHLNNLIKLIQDCGVSFAIWKNKAGEIEWTSLSGSDKIKLLLHLPDKLNSHDGVLYENTKTKIVQLWKNFYILYKFINETTDTGANIFEKAKSWLEHFLDIGKDGRKGYHGHNVTPYMHCLVYHIPFFACTYGPLRNFSGQGVEKNNDIVKQIHQKKSNKWDSAVSALTTRKRLEFGCMNNLERNKRSYAKTSDWWDVPIRNSRSGKRKGILEEIAQADAKTVDSECFEKMSEYELRIYLKSHGVNTKVRSREKLMDLISSLSL